MIYPISIRLTGYVVWNFSKSNGSNLRLSSVNSSGHDIRKYRSFVTAPCRVNTMKFVYPAFQVVTGVPTLTLRQLEEAWSGLHVPNLVNDYDGQHSPSRCVFLARYLSE